MNILYVNDLWLIAKQLEQMNQTAKKSFLVLWEPESKNVRLNLCHLQMSWGLPYDISR